MRFYTKVKMNDGSIMTLTITAENEENLLQTIQSQYKNVKDIESYKTKQQYTQDIVNRNAVTKEFVDVKGIVNSKYRRARLLG